MHVAAALTKMLIKGDKLYLLKKITQLSKKIFDKIPEQQQMVHTDRSCPSWRQDLQVLATRGAEMMGIEGIHIYSMGYRHTVVQTW